MSEYKMTIVRIDKNEKYEPPGYSQFNAELNNKYIEGRILEITLTENEMNVIRKGVLEVFK